MNLYELTKTYQDLQEMVENGEDLEETLNLIGDAIEVKADGYARVIRNMEGNIEAIKTEQARLQEKKKALENGIERLKKNLYDAMKATGKEKFNTNLFRFAIAKNGGAMPVILDKPVEDLPRELTKVDIKPDLKAIAQYIENTGDMTYAHYGERGESLRIK